MANLIFKICEDVAWRTAEREGVFHGSPVDLADGYIHLSTAEQTAETLRIHYGGQDRLIIAAVDEHLLGNAIRYEPARSGELFPHLYGSLPMSAIVWTEIVRLGPDGKHEIPDLSDFKAERP